MKRNWNLALLALALVLGMTVVGCDDGDDGGGNPRKVTYQSADAAGYTYILIITVNGSTTAAGDSYVLTIKKTGQSDKISKGKVSAVGAGGILTLQPKNSGSDPFTVTISSGQMTKIEGTIAVEGEGESVTAPGTVTPQENGGDDGGKGKWKSWGDAITFSVSADGIVTVNVIQEGAPDTGGVQLPYDGIKNKTFKYSFQAWTKSGTRDIRVCFGSEKRSESDDIWYPNQMITITSTVQAFELEHEISNRWQDFNLGFNCSGAIGEWYLKIVSIDYSGSSGGGGGGGSGGTFTLTDIPSQHNGKYAFLMATNISDREVYGWQSVNMTTQTITLPVISNGSVSLPTWTWTGGTDVVRYSGSDTARVEVGISNSATIKGDNDENITSGIRFDSVTFSNGSATRSWSQGTSFNVGSR